jgi:Domain of unknown function (DUF4139)/N-terminal domain of unknown function (DUF4140)
MKLALCTGALVTLASLAAAPTAARAATAPPPPELVPAKIDTVLVYSTEARVFREAKVALKARGARRVALVDLPRLALPGTLKVECKSARVEGVEVIRTRGNLPQQAKAKELVDKIELVTDRLTDLEDERQVLQQELSFIEALGLRREPTGTAPRPGPEGLFAGAWQQILSWMGQRSGKLRARLALLAAERRTQHKALHKLKVEAREGFDPAALNRQVSRVVATVAGGVGAHKVRLSYRVAGVRWVPSYDLRYLPARRAVEATYYATVNQRSGEDWDRARLRFSTGLPTQLLAVPELPTWTLGRKRDFTPTPRPRTEPGQVPWTPAPPPRIHDPALTRLVALMQGRRMGWQSTTPKKPAGPADQPDNDRDGIQDEEDEGEDDGKDSFEDIDGRPDVTRQQKLEDLRQRVRRERKRVYRSRYKRRLLKETVLAGKARPRKPYPASPTPEPSADRLTTLSLKSPPAAQRASFSGLSLGSSRSSYVPRETVPWTDTGYRGPSLHPDLPAAAAKGYRFTLYAPGRHSVKANGSRRRVPVLRKRLSVQPVYRIVPGASKRAYLLARVKNTTGRPILRGHANLFAGSMFTGRSWLNTALPGKTIELPLGVDDAVKVERHLRQKTVVKGMVFKDDITEYTVQIEIANHHKRAIDVELIDQLPVKQGRKVEVKAFSAKPAQKAGPDKKDGRITFKVRVAASSVKKVTFSFQIVRPKDWELSQHDY